MDINQLKSLMTAAKSSDHMYEQQTAAMVFATKYGEQLITVVLAAKDYLDKDCADTQHILTDALAALEEEI